MNAEIFFYVEIGVGLLCLATAGWALYSVWRTNRDYEKAMQRYKKSLDRLVVKSLERDKSLEQLRIQLEETEDREPDGS